MASTTNAYGNHTHGNCCLRWFYDGKWFWWCCMESQDCLVPFCCKILIRRTVIDGTVKYKDVWIVLLLKCFLRAFHFISLIPIKYDFRLDRNVFKIHVPWGPDKTTQWCYTLLYSFIILFQVETNGMHGLHGMGPVFHNYGMPQMFAKVFRIVGRENMQIQLIEMCKD